jgi:hypothetical protein
MIFGLALAAALALAIAAVATPSADPSRTAKVAWFSSAGLTIQGKLGSSCLPSGTSRMVCRDAATDPMPTLGRLPLRAGSRIVVRTGTAATLVDVQLLTASGDAAPNQTGKTMRAQPLGRAKLRWAATLPTNLDGAELMRAFVRYAVGDATFAIRIRLDSSCSREAR